MFCEKVRDIGPMWYYGPACKAEPRVPQVPFLQRFAIGNPQILNLSQLPTSPDPPAAAPISNSDPQPPPSSLRPPPRRSSSPSSSLTSPRLPPVAATLACDGGASGVEHVGLRDRQVHRRGKVRQGLPRPREAGWFSEALPTDSPRCPTPSPKISPPMRLTCAWR